MPTEILTIKMNQNQNEIKMNLGIQIPIKALLEVNIFSERKTSPFSCPSSPIPTYLTE